MTPEIIANIYSSTAVGVGVILAAAGLGLGYRLGTDLRKDARRYRAPT